MTKNFNSQEKFWSDKFVNNYIEQNISKKLKKNKLFKRDFAGEIMNKYKYELIDYGFTYRYDKFPQDDLTWFLLKKKN